MIYCEKCGNKIEPKSNFCEKCGKSFKKPEYNRRTLKQRPTFLTVWLILMIISSAFSLLFSFARPILIPFILVNFILIWALFNWKKWGFYGYVIFSLVGLILGPVINNSLYAYVHSTKEGILVL